MKSPARIPRATFRIQVHKHLTLAQVRELVPLLSKMGISDVYLSPITEARPGSTHGYDVINPARINPEIGGEEEFAALAADLQHHGMGILADIVPNHMAASTANLWWMDVLENGASSAYASFFDIEWSADGPSPGLREIYLPTLGDPFGTVLEKRQFRLAFDTQGLGISYYATRLPLDPSTYTAVLHDPPEPFHDVVEIIQRLPDRDSSAWESVEARRRDVPLIKQKLFELYEQSAESKAWLDARIAAINDSPDDMEQLLSAQAYRLAWWHVARERINYRRFFDVSDLIALRQDNDFVFGATHELICKWVNSGSITGLRVDHVDGLLSPRAYLHRLANDCGQRPYIVVEKILLGSEDLPPEWEIDGTSGYDFLGFVNNLFVDGENLGALQETYTRVTGLKWTLPEAAYEQKRWITRHLFQGEMFALGLQIGLLAELDRHARDLTPSELRQALLAVTACLPVYRTYIEADTIRATDRACIVTAIAEARRRNPEVGAAVFDFVERVFLLRFPAHLTEEQRANWTRFVMRWQQLTGPIAAKGVEDTALYLYNRLISMNDVGGQTDAVSPRRFHEFNLHRAERWPHTMNATSTHDTKRSEDVRARLNVLSEMPARWNRTVTRWSRWNKAKKVSANAPDPNEEILLYQTMLGAWPFDDQHVDSFIARLKEYATKAVREAKIYSSWLEPNEEHERAIHGFVDALMGDTHFRESFHDLQRELAWYGAINSLSQTLLKIVSPGVPDFYQGTFLWDLSLVDPDNRRPLDIETHRNLYHQMDGWRPASLLENWTDGRVKAYVICTALHAGIAGDYIPVNTNTDHVVAVARRDRNRWRLAVVPRFVSQLAPAGRMPVGRRIWKDATLELPAGAPTKWRNEFTGQKVASTDIAAILSEFPVALLSA